MWTNGNGRKEFFGEKHGIDEVLAWGEVVGKEDERGGGGLGEEDFGGVWVGGSWEEGGRGPKGEI